MDSFGMDLLGVFAASGVSLGESPTWTASLIALIALSAMEIVLGIDNIIFISIATSKLQPEEQKKARFIGLAMAMGVRILLLCFIATIAGWTKPILVLDEWLPDSLSPWFIENAEINEVSVRDLILFLGGLFLIFQSVREIHHLTAGQEEHDETSTKKSRRVTFKSVILQITLLDIVFSLDSVITAVGMVDSVAIMIAAVILSVLVMMIFAGPISSFVLRNPSIKVLALSFLLMIGVMLLAEGFGSHFNKNYVYFAMVFSLGVEIVNMRVARKANT